MENVYSRFERRSNAVRTKHLQMADGFVTRINGNGVLVQVPAKRRGGLSVGTLLIALLCAVLIKAMNYLQLGESAYAARTAELAQGSSLEQAGAFILQMDPATLWIAQQIATFLN